MPHATLATLADCEGFLKGCLLMATGGGGSVQWGMGMLREALAAGVTLEWVDAGEVPDDVCAVTPYGMGTIAPPSVETLEEIERGGAWSRQRPCGAGHRSSPGYSGR